MKSERHFKNIDDINTLFDDLELEKYISSDKKVSKDFIDFYSRECETPVPNPEISDVLDFLAEKIFNINKEAKNLETNNTKEKSTNRVSPYISDASRKKLHNSIISCCLVKPRNCIDAATSLELDKDGLAPSEPTFGLKKPKAFIILGGPACGKSTYASTIADYYSAFLVDSDIIKHKIPEFYNSPAGATLVHEESKDIYAEIMKFLCSMRTNVVTPITGKSYDSICEAVTSFQENNYDVYLILAHINKSNACLRSLIRFIKSNRYVPLGYILDICGHEAVANFYKYCCKNPKIKALAIDNTDKKGKIDFDRKVDDIVKILKKKGKIKK